MRNVKRIGCIGQCAALSIQIKSTISQSQSQSPFMCLFFFCRGVRGSCFMSCLVPKSVGLQRNLHLWGEAVWTHQTDRDLCEDRHEADCTHSTRHAPLGEAERTKEVKLQRLAQAILLITIWSLFPPTRLRALRAISLFHLYFICHSQLTSNVGSLSLQQKLPLPVSHCLSHENLHSDLADNRLQNSHISLMYVNIYNIRFSDDQMHVC